MFRFINTYKIISIALLVVCSALVNSQQVNAEVNAKKERVRMKLYYSKNDAGERLISIGLTAGSGKNMHGLANAEVVLTAIVDDSTYVLATQETDTLGLLDLYLDSDYVLPMDEDGKTVIEAIYEGDDVYRSASNDLELMDVDLDFSFEIEDSVKYLSVSAKRIDKAGNKIPVEELELIVGVERLYSVLPLDDMETDENGVATMEIPDDLPGDAKGNLTFVAKIDEHDEFGTVTESADQMWGIPVSYEVKPLPRQLYTDEAPLWMIASVCVILLGAWYHFFLSISKLIKLKKAS